MNRLLESKTEDILKMKEEKKRHGEENMKGITQLILEKEKLEEDHARVVLKLSSDRESEVSKLSQAMLLVQEQLQGREKVCRDLEKKVKEGQGRVEQKEEELRLVKRGQEEIR